MCACFPDANSFIQSYLCVFLSFEPLRREAVCLSVDVWDAFSLAFTHTISPYSALTLGRRQSSRSSWCRGRPPSCLMWEGSGGWRRRSRSEKPGQQMERCQCSDRTRSRSLDGCHTCEEDTEYLNIKLLLIINMIFTLQVARHIRVNVVYSARHWKASS